MEVQTELRPMFSYSILILISAFIITVGFAILIKKIKFKPKKNNIYQVKIPIYKNVINIKRKYLNKLDKLYNDLNNNNISSRKAYQELSKIIRNFIFETTDIEVHNYTLNEIKMINMPILYELVKEYYDPEFAKISKGNIALSINKTRMVIERWK